MNRSITDIINNIHTFGIYFLILAFSLCIPENVLPQANHWQKLYFHPSHYDISGTAICSSGDNNFLVLSDSQYPEGTIIYKLNQYGDTLLTSYIPEVRGFCGITDYNGGMLFSGKASNNYPLYSFLAKVNLSGQVIYNNSYPNSDPASLYDLTKSSSGHYLICGKKSRNGYVAKLDSAGQLIWQKVFFASDLHSIYSIADAPDNGYLYSAMIKDSLTSPYFMSSAVAKLDTSGNKIWEHRYFSQDSLQYFSYLKLVRHNEGCIIGGTHLDNTASREFLELIKLDKNGTIKYRLPFDISSQYTYTLSDLKILSNNRIIILYSKGNLPSTDSVLSGAFIVDTLGNIIANNEYMTNTKFTSLSKIIDNPNPTNIIFTGTTDYNSVYERVLVVKTDSTLYAPPVSVNNISQTVPDNFYLNQNYPNPFNNTTQIVFGIKKKGMYNLKIYDVTGKLISEIFNQSFEPGEYKTEIHADNLSSGVYFYRLESKIFSSTKKFVLLK